MSAQILTLGMKEFAGAAHARRAGAPSRLLVAAAAILMFAAGCGERGKTANTEGGKKTAAAVSDTAAYHGAMAQTDTTARIAALQDFLKNYASSPFRPAVYSRLCDLLERKSPDQSAAFLSEHLQSERDPASRGRIYYAQYTHAKDHAPGEVGTVIQALENDASPDANVYNMVAWDLVEQGTRLDDAVKLASIGADKAPDSLSKAEVLDTKGWAQFTKGDYREAAGTLELAVGLGPKEEDIRGHLAEACDKAGDAARARDLYAGLLVAHEDPQMRSRLEALVRQTGGSAKNVFQKIDADRKAQARPAADFALQDYDGKEIQFAGATRGKVVLLDFWHPT